MRTYSSMGEAVADAMEANNRLVWKGKCGEKLTDGIRTVATCFEAAGSHEEHKGWGSGITWPNESAL